MHSFIKQVTVASQKGALNERILNVCVALVVVIDEEEEDAVADAKDDGGCRHHQTYHLVSL